MDILIVLNFLIVSSFLIVELFIRKKGIFYPTVLSLAFSLLSALVSFYYIFNPVVLEDYFVSGVIDREVLCEVFSLYILINVLMYCSFLICMSGNYKLINGFLRFMNYDGLLTGKTKSTSFLFVLYFFNVLIFFYFINSIGGLSYLWSNLGSRQDLFAGYGYMMKATVISLQVIAIAIFIKFFLSNRFASYLIVILTAGILLTLGGRMPVLGFIFAVVMAFHFTFQKINFKVIHIPIVIMCFLCSIFVSELRKPGMVSFFGNDMAGFFKELLTSSFEHVLPYATTVKRDVVVVNYFKDHEFWYGASYTSLLYAVIPSKIFPNKPPIDTGRYIVAMSQGESITPPVATAELPNYGYPDGFMAGYVNFAYLGLIVIVFVSALFVSIVYKYAINSPSAPSYMLYSLVTFMGLSYLDPLNIVKVLTFVFFVFMIVCFVRFIKACQ